MAALPAVHSESKVVSVGPSFDLFGLENHALTLAERSERATFEGARSEIHLAAIIVPNDDPGSGAWIVSLDHALHMRAL